MNRENLVADLRRIDAEHEYLGIGTVLSNIQTFDDSEVEGFHAFFSRVVSVLESYSESQRRAFLGELAKIYQRDAFALRRAMWQYASRLRELQERNENAASDPLADLDLL